MVFLLYRGRIYFSTERDFWLTRLSAIISPYLAKFMKRIKSITEFLHEIVIMFSPIYLSETTYAISSFNLMSELLQKLIPDGIIVP